MKSAGWSPGSRRRPPPQAANNVGALKRFISLGARDADARVEAFLAPRSFEASDNYLRGSKVVRTIDEATRRLHAWSRASMTGRSLRSLAEQWRHTGWAAQSRLIAVVLLSAATVNVLLTALNGPRPGWFWLIVPALAAVLAALLLAGSPSQSSQ